MRTRLSEFVDGECASDDKKILFEALRRGDDLRGCWREYLLIGAALQGEDLLDADITERVMTALEDEPVVFAPRAAAHRVWQRAALAVAATLAGVGAVAWMALAPKDVAEPLLVQREAAVAQPVRQTTRDMREYLAAHQAQSSSLQFRGGTENIRTVSAGAAAAK